MKIILLLLSLLIVKAKAFIPHLPKSHSTTTTTTTSWQHQPPSSSSLVEVTRQCTWSPQDLTKDSPGHLPIPDDDYIKMYQGNPDLWPVEFFLIVYRRRPQDGGTQILVRPSANGTSKYGVGTGVPVTRWMLSSSNKPPIGYMVREPPVTFDAKNFPEFPKGEEEEKEEESWTYHKIDIREDAFDDTEFKDDELEDYAKQIRKELRVLLSNKMNSSSSSWDSSLTLVVKNALDKPNSIAAIQGTLRMSGIFDFMDGTDQRFVSLSGKNNNNKNNAAAATAAAAPDPTVLAQSCSIYTMFPQMPDPMPLPSCSTRELQNEIVTRESRMVKSGRDPHIDQYGRIFTHKSTSNVSNTIHGVYLTLDATDLLKDTEDVPYALDLFGTKKVKREWVSLQDLKVLDGQQAIGTEDTKPTFISGFIVRQLVTEGVIDIRR